MELKYTTGCICDSMTVDGVEEIDLENDEIRKDVLERIGDYIGKLNLDDNKYDRLVDSMCGYLDLDEKEIKGKTTCELGSIIKNTHPYNLNYILQFVIPDFGEVTYHSEKPCECCGDYVWEHTLIV